MSNINEIATELHAPIRKVKEFQTNQQIIYRILEK